MFNLKSILLIIILSLILSIFSLYNYSETRKTHINCKANMFFEYNESIFEGSIKFITKEKTGYVTLIGDLLINNTKTKIQRTIYFNYKVDGHDYIMTSYEIVKLPLDMLTLGKDIIKIVPSFYTKINNSRHFTIIPYKDSYLIYTSQIPTMDCKIIK